MAEMVFPSTTPNNGKSTTGSNAVTASGMASVIHQMAINIAMASVYVIFGFSGARLPNRISDRLISGAMTSAASFTFEFPRVACMVVLSSDFLVSLPATLAVSQGSRNHKSKIGYYLYPYSAGIQN